jgi:hypothetical protein
MGFKVKPKYKVGDLVFDTRDDQRDVTYEITKIVKDFYHYNIYLKNKLHTNHKYRFDQFEPETRLVTKLDKILK